MPIKFRDGYSSLGRQAAVYFEAQDEPVLTKRRDDVLVRKNGDFIQVFREQKDDVAAVYAIGRNIGGTWEVRGAANAAGVFSLIGPPQDGVSLLPNGFNYGRGLIGSVRLSAGSAPTVDDFNGQAWTAAVFDMTRSRRGIEPEGHYQVDAISPNFILGASSFVFITIPPGYRDVDGTPTFYTGAMVTQMGAGGQPAHRFVVDNGETFGLGATLGYPSAVAFYSTSFVLAPGVLMKMDRYLRAGAPYTTTPAAVFTYSTDAGATWAVAPMPAMCATEIASVETLTTTAPDLDLFNAAVRVYRLIAAPLSRTTSVVLGVVPYIDAGEVKARVKMGVVDAATYDVTGGTVLFDGDPAEADLFLKDVLAIDGAVLVFTRPMTPDTDVFSRPARVQKTLDGAALTDVGYLPFIERRTGVCRAVSRRRLVLPVFDDGAYRLYQSTDVAVTWSARAVIYAGGAAPAGESNLVDFADVIYPRQGSAPANPLPATPWLTDIRIDP